MIRLRRFASRCPFVPRRSATCLAAALVLATGAAFAAPAKVAAKPPARAAQEPLDIVTYGAREDVVAFADDLARRRGLDAAWIRDKLAQARFLPSVAKAIMPPPAGVPKNWAAYRARFIEPRRIRTVASQVDLPVTLLSLMGIAAEHPMIGRDLTRAAADEPGRAMMQYEQNYAWMEGERVVVLRPDQAPAHGRYDPQRKRLENGAAPDDGDELARRALAHALLPAWLYREQRYRLPETAAGARLAQAAND